MASPIIDFRVRLPNDQRPMIDVPSEVTDQYDAVLDMSTKIQQTLADLKAEMDAVGVAHAVVHAEFEVGDPADALNEAVARVVKQDPERFTGIGTVSMEPFSVMRALGQIDACATAGMVGITLQPSFFRMPIDDRRLYPVYAKAVELDLMVCLHTGINYGVTHPIRNDHPLMLDDVACDFPDLKLVACHAGWPWVAEMVAVARKHPNVYMEFGGPGAQIRGRPGHGLGSHAPVHEQPARRAGAVRHRLAGNPDGARRRRVARDGAQGPRARQRPRRQRSPSPGPLERFQFDWNRVRPRPRPAGSPAPPRRRGP